MRNALEAASKPSHENSNFAGYLKDNQKLIEQALKDWFSNCKERVVEAACYSLLLPSKRLRPLFCLETCRAFSNESERALPAAMALEMIHTYSLIHDDLPAMDDDLLRRGQPTNHRKYGEATAILAGDGLLTSAFEVLSSAGTAGAEVRVAWVKELSRAAGMEGMVLGQDWDIDPKRVRSAQDIEGLHRRKTGALLSASVVLGGLAAEVSKKTIDALRDFALDMGLAFQIHDDILDVEGGKEMGKPVKSDQRNERPTFVSYLGLEKSKREARSWFESAMKKLRAIPFKSKNRLEDLTEFVISRRV